ncbi:MAG: hypothetical protein ACI4LC_08015 [Emergencia sp.]
MKRIAVIVFAVVMCISMTACGQKSEPKAGADDIGIRVTNEAGDDIVGMGVDWFVADQCFKSTGMQPADGGTIGEEPVEFVLTGEEIPQDANLNEFGVRFNVQNEKGVEFDICTLYFPAEPGNEYSFEVRIEDGSYAVWAEIDDSVHSGRTIAKLTESM